MPQSQMANTNIITPIKAFTDNYIWAITSKNSNNLALVDPGDARVCIDFIEKNSLILTSLLITHHHADHIGGIKELYHYCQQHQWPLEIYTPSNESIPHASVKLVEGDTVTLDGLETTFNIIDIPGHTLGHIAYYQDNVLFCGDTLFSAGCGRIFEGTAQQMFDSLNKLKKLPERTHVYCTHEYTLANLDFALTVEPENEELINYYNHVKQLRARDKISLPSSILREKKINPFLRCDEQPIQYSVQEYSNQIPQSELETFSLLRQWKDNF